MQAKGNMEADDGRNHDDSFVVHDAREARFGLCFMSDLDTDDFRSLPGAAVRVYMVLTVFASRDQREAYPTQRRLAAITGLSRETVNRAIRLLCSCDFLRKRTAGKLTVYTLISHPGGSK